MSLLIWFVLKVRELLRGEKSAPYSDDEAEAMDQGNAP